MPKISELTSLTSLAPADVLLALDADAGITRGIAGSVLFPPALNVLYVGKHGNDSNAGTTKERPLATIDRSMVLATALGPADNNHVRVEILDTGEYAESFAQPDYVHIIGETATVYGEIGLGAQAKLSLYRLRAYADDLTLLTKAAGAGTSYVVITELDGTGPASGAAAGSGTRNNVRCAFNNAGQGVLFLQTPKTFVGISGEGVATSEVGFGHLHWEVEDAYGKTGALIVAANVVNSSAVCRFGHMLKLSGATNVTGIKMGSSGKVTAVGTEINVDIPWDMGNATRVRDLRLLCPEIIGSPIGVPEVVVSNTHLRLPDLPTADPGITGLIWNDAGTLKVSS